MARRELTSIDVAEAIFYFALTEAGKNKFSPKQIDTYRFVRRLVEEKQELRKHFTFRGDYSSELDNAMHFLTMSQIIWRPAWPGNEYHQIPDKNLKQIEKKIKSEFPEKLLSDIEKGVKAIRETDEFKKFAVK